jgi:hypothetical protein
VKITVRARLSTVAMLLDDATVEPSTLSPDPSCEKRREEEKRAQGPLPVLLLPARRRPPCPRQSRPTAPRGQAITLLARERGRRDRGELQTQPGPRAGELLVALFLNAPAYKRPRRSNGATHPVPSYLPDTLA